MERLCGALGNEGATLIIIAGAPCALFVALGLLQHALETFAPHALAPYKLQPRVHVTPAEWRDVWAVAAVSWAISIALGAVEAWWLLPALGAPRACDAPAPALSTVLTDFVVFLVVEEVLFYYVHRALHEVAYAHVHKVHHRFKAPVSVAAVYAHPLEHVLANVGPAAAGPLLMRSHAFTAAAWTTLVIVSTMNAHSGYKLPFLALVSDAAKHDWHHESSRDCYGPLGLLDWLHGTRRGPRGGGAKARVE